jgi:hypothetical protein
VEVGAEEEDLHVAVGLERVGELGQLLADPVEVALLLRDLEQGFAVDPSDLFQ